MREYCKRHCVDNCPMIDIPPRTGIGQKSVSKRLLSIVSR